MDSHFVVVVLVRTTWRPTEEIVTITVHYLSGALKRNCLQKTENV